MCRMLGCVGPHEGASRAILRFRRLADEGKVLLAGEDGHRDGWGVVAGRPPVHLGRSVLDASRDAEYETAARRVASVPGSGAALVHLRAASAGAVQVENSHPFLGDGLAFCHNGTIRGLAGPGGSDSRGYFAMVLEERRAGLTPADALVAAARRIHKERTYSSTTALLTDGATLWGLRKVGDDPEECADKACAIDYYTLAVSRAGGLTVVTQEREPLPQGSSWEVVPDGHLVTVAPDGSWSIRRWE